LTKQLPLLIILFAASTAAATQVIFQKRYGGAADDRGFSVQQTNDNGYITVGYTNSFGADTTDVYLIKTNSNGDTLWTKTFGGINVDQGNCVQQTLDGGYIITGNTYSFGAGNSDVYLIKTDINGDALWTKTYGGADDDGGLFVQQTTDSGYIVTGYASSFDAGFEEVYLIKTNSSGDTLWTKTYGGGNSTSNSNEVHQTFDGGYIVTGYTSLNAGNFDVYLIKTNSAGNATWTKKYGSASHDYGNSVQQTTDSGYIVTGETDGFGAGNADVYLIKTDANGDTLWTRTYGGSLFDAGYSVKQTSDGGYIVAGLTYSFFGTGSTSDVYLIRTNSFGDTLWTKTFGGVSIDEGHSVQQTTDGGFIVSGFTWPFLGSVKYDSYLIKCDSSGYSNCNDNYPASVVNKPSTIVAVPSTVVSSASTVVSAAATIEGRGGNVTTMCITVGYPEIPASNSFTISPNPSAGHFVISFERTLEKGNIEIYNILGENIFTENITNESKEEITVNNVSSGIYLVKVSDEKKQYNGKLIIDRD